MSESSESFEEPVMDFEDSDEVKDSWKTVLQLGESTVNPDWPVLSVGLGLPLEEELLLQGTKGRIRRSILRRSKLEIQFSTNQEKGWRKAVLPIRTTFFAYMPELKNK